MNSSRSLVLNCLVKMAKQNGYSNIVLDDMLKKSNLSEQDKKFASALFYGVIERQLTLDIIIKKYSSRTLDKLSIEVREILRMGIYQLLFMDSVPESAAVNESVVLAKKNKNPAISGFVNALLRSFIRDGKNIPEGKTEIETLSLKYSCPQWLVVKFIKDYGKKNAQTMLKSSLGRVPITARVNNTKITIDELIKELKKEDIVAEKSKVIDNCLVLINCSGIENSLAYKNGYFHVQDISSQLCCEALNPKEGEVVLDLCSAPGGKAFTMAEKMNNKGQIYAFDLHEKRAQLIWKGSKRLGLDIIKAGTNNAKVFNDKILQADKILCDVPCSGLGVIRRKPEIKFKNPSDFEKIPEIQYQILETSARYLKDGGELIYSTCTLNKSENDDVIDKFLDNHSEFEKVKVLPDYPSPFGNYKVSIFTDFCNSDGFFIAKIRKKR